MPLRLTPAKIHELYDLLSVPMIDFDCGALCAPTNDGVPACCDIEHAVPMLYRDEYRWLRKKSTFWKRYPRRGAEDREYAESMEDEFRVLAVCPGAKRCDRAQRSLVCRTFPFEPFVDGRGRMLGLTYNTEAGRSCPLTSRGESSYNPRYLKNCRMFWETVLEIFPDERNMYIEESRRRKRLWRRRGRAVPLFACSKAALTA
jgi:hypothetical protein